MNQFFANSDVLVPPIGQGCDFIDPAGSPSRYSPADIEVAVRQGIDKGLTLLDTAESYGAGQSEELIGRVLTDVRKDVFLSTKIAPENTHFRDVIKSCEMSLRRLGTDYIDLYQIHWRNTEVPIAETMEAMERLISEGKIRFVGISNFALSEVIEANTILGDIPLSSLQTEYNLFNRTAEDEFLPYCEEQEMTVIAYSPLDKGRIANGERGVKLLGEIGQAYGLTAAQVALRWVTSKKGVVAIVKARSPQHISEVAVAASDELDPADIKLISDSCMTRVQSIPVNQIRVAPSDDRGVYRTLQEALDNRHGDVPSPLELSNAVGAGLLKPTRVRAVDDDGSYRYELLEGRIRYWAWVIAKGEDAEISAIVQED